MNAPLRVFSIEVVEAPSIALVVATRSRCLVQPNLKSQAILYRFRLKKMLEANLRQSSTRRLTTMERSCFKD
jgi:hypothetical protein